MMVVKLTRPDGSAVYINPEHVVRVAPGENDRFTQITLVNGEQTVKESVADVVKQVQR